MKYQRDQPVYLVRPTRSRLLRTCLSFGVPDAVLIVWLVYFVKTTPPFAPGQAEFAGTYFGPIFVFIAAPLAILPLTFWFVLVLYRLLRPDISLAITPDGIVDNCSLFALGVGLIRWENLLAVYPHHFRGSIYAKDNWIVLRVSDPSLIEDQPGVAALLRKIFVLSWRSYTDIHIPGFMLDRVPGDMMAPIRKEYHAARDVDHRLAAHPPIPLLQ